MRPYLEPQLFRAARAPLNIAAFLDLEIQKCFANLPRFRLFILSFVILGQAPVSTFLWVIKLSSWSLRVAPAPSADSGTPGP